jgi:hypothetical protein
MDVTPTDLVQSASTCRAALEPVLALDWAGELS